MPLSSTPENKAIYQKYKDDKLHYSTMKRLKQGYIPKIETLKKNNITYEELYEILKDSYDNKENKKDLKVNKKEDL